VFPRDPAKLLVVGAGDPMWRGGLSAPNSYFMHADRPLVSENGTSSLVHELVHVFSRISDTDNSDWISEGIAEYYAIEVMRRAGGLSEDRYQKVREHLIKWSKPVKSLRTETSTGPVTARAVLLLQELDREIRQATWTRPAPRTSSRSPKTSWAAAPRCWIPDFCVDPLGHRADDARWSIPPQPYA